MNLAYVSTFWGAFELRAEIHQQMHKVLVSSSWLENY